MQAATGKRARASQRGSDSSVPKHNLRGGAFIARGPALRYGHSRTQPNDTPAGQDFNRPVLPRLKEPPRDSSFSMYKQVRLWCIINS